MVLVMSLIVFPMSIGFVSRVDFKKWPCHPVEIKGQGPLVSLRPSVIPILIRIVLGIQTVKTKYSYQQAQYTYV